MDIGIVRDAMIAKRQILLQGDVNLGIREYITRSILYFNAVDDTPITLFIDSPGGDISNGLCICDALEQSHAEVRGVVVAKAFSAAFTILQSCHRRLAYPRARLMFHAPEINTRRVDADDWSEYVKEIQEQHQGKLSLYAQRSGQSMKQLEKWSKVEKYFLADEALKFGFLDEVIEPPKK